MPERGLCTGQDMTYEQAIQHIVLHDKRYLVMTAENRAPIKSIPPVLGDRFIDVGIAEQSLVGFAAGLSLRGRIPIVHALASFLTMRSFEFIRTDIGIPGLPVKLVGYIPGFLSEANGPTHQAVEDIALMRSIPSMHIFCPADLDDMLIGLRTVLEYPGPFYIRFNPLCPSIRHEPDFQIGKAEIVSEGEDVAILTYGMLFREAHAAKALLNSAGVSIRLVNLRTLKPLDEETILTSAEKTGFLVTLEDHFLTGGLYSIVSEILIKNRVRCKVLPLGLRGGWFQPGVLNEVLAHEGFTSDIIAQTIIKEKEIYGHAE